MFNLEQTKIATQSVAILFSVGVAFDILYDNRYTSYQLVGNG